MRPGLVDKFLRSLVRQRYVYFSSPFSSMPVNLPACSAGPLVEIGLPSEAYSTSVDSMSVTLPACSAGPLDETDLLHDFPRRLGRRCAPSPLPSPKSCGFAFLPMSSNLPARSVGPLGTVALPPFYSSPFDSMSDNLPARSAGPLDEIGLLSSPHPPSSDDANRSTRTRRSKFCNTKAHVPKRSDHKFFHAKCQENL